MKYVSIIAFKTKIILKAVVQPLKPETVRSRPHVTSAPAQMIGMLLPRAKQPPSNLNYTGFVGFTRAEVSSNLSAAVKRLLDIVIAGSAVVLLSPMLIGILVMVRLDSRGPAIFSQVRVGKDARPFTIYKFRSMHRDAEKQRAQILDSSDRQGLCFKAKADIRITRAGRFLRRWSLDELPQIFNVLKGEMSIVGPRPALPEEVAAYPKRALGRLAVKPGITGVWQVSGRADVGFDEMVDLDLAYIRAQSTLLDVVLMALTFRAVLTARGAY